MKTVLHQTRTTYTLQHPGQTIFYIKNKEQYPTINHYSTSISTQIVVE